MVTPALTNSMGSKKIMGLSDLEKQQQHALSQEVPQGGSFQELKPFVGPLYAFFTSCVVAPFFAFFTFCVVAPFAFFKSRLTTKPRTTCERSEKYSFLEVLEAKTSGICTFNIPLKEKHFLELGVSNPYSLPRSLPWHQAIKWANNLEDNGKLGPAWSALSREAKELGATELKTLMKSTRLYQPGGLEETWGKKLHLLDGKYVFITRKEGKEYVDHSNGTLMYRPHALFLQGDDVDKLPVKLVFRAEALVNGYYDIEERIVKESFE